MKLNLKQLESKAKFTANKELLNSISGGLENACHGTVEQNPDGTFVITVHK